MVETKRRTIYNGARERLSATDGEDCQWRYVTLPDGREVSLFVNKATGLVVVDVVDADEDGGLEILRQTV